jgi:ubiquinone/menaquinone biosynthesis C-methylase UbiE
MLNLLHRVASIGWVYDLIQNTLGAPSVLNRLRFHLNRCGHGARVLDVGGGTGAIGKMLPADCIYYCLDIERPKLLRYIDKSSEPRPILADAGRMPVKTASVDVVVCSAVIHHLSSETLRVVFDEITRVIKPGGKVILFDPVADARRWLSRLLWYLDRGSYPRTPSVLKSAFESNFRIDDWEELAGYHRYVLGVGTR